MKNDTALKILWDSCIHNEETKEAYEVLKNDTRPQGEWLFTEIDENYHVYGQCSVCKERNRIGKACRSCGARMKGVQI